MLKKWLFLLLIVSLIATGGIFYLARKKVFSSKKMYTNPLFQTTIDRLEFSYPPAETTKQSAIVNFQNGRWLVKEPPANEPRPANQEIINSLVNRLTSVAQLEVVSTNKEYLPRFDLDKENQVVIKVFTKENSKPEELYVGKISADFQHTYIAFSSNGPVLLFPADRFLLLPSELVLENPLEGKLSDLQKVAKLVYKKGNKEVEIDHQFKGDKWIEKGSLKKEIKAGDIERWIDEIKGFQTKEVKKLSLKGSVSSLQVDFTNNKKFELKFLKDKEGYWLTTSDWPDFGWKVEGRLVKESNDFFGIRF